MRGNVVEVPILLPTDQAYNPESDKAQSGIAVAEAISKATGKKLDFKGSAITTGGYINTTEDGIYIISSDNTYVSYEKAITPIPITGFHIMGDNTYIEFPLEYADDITIIACLSGLYAGVREKGSTASSYQDFSIWVDSLSVSYISEQYVEAIVSFSGGSLEEGKEYEIAFVGWSGQAQKGSIVFKANGYEVLAGN